MQAQKERPAKNVEDEEQTQDEESDDESPFTEIDKLQEFGINGGDINKLKAHGLCTVLGCIQV